MEFLPIQEHKPLTEKHLAALQEEKLAPRISYYTWGFDEHPVQLIQYQFDCEHPERKGYYAYYRIGAEWLDSEHKVPVVVVPKMEGIDFLRMFMTCLKSEMAESGFSRIYSIDFEQPPIFAPALHSVLSPLLVIYYLTLVKKLIAKGIKKGYVNKEGNLRKVKGRINLQQNDRKNIQTLHYEHVYCNYQEYSIDIPENRILKKALLSASSMLSYMQNYPDIGILTLLLHQCLTAFENVDDKIEPWQIQQIKANKLFSGYKEAIDVARQLLRQYDLSISDSALSSGLVPVFRIDMALLYEHYVYSLMNEAYGSAIVYQFKAATGIPDFLFAAHENRAVLDTKYVPAFNNQGISPDYIRQLSGYARDIKVLRRLGYKDITPHSICPSVPCVIIYPTWQTKSLTTKGVINPFLKTSFKNLLRSADRKAVQFYKFPVEIPKI